MTTRGIGVRWLAGATFISHADRRVLCTPLHLIESGCDRGYRPDHTPSQRTARLCATILDRRDTSPARPFSTAVNREWGEPVCYSEPP